MTGDNALKACPFCAGTDVVIAQNFGGTAFWPVCGGCGAELKTQPTEELARDAWNTRSPVEDARGGLVEALKPFAKVAWLFKRDDEMTVACRIVADPEHKAELSTADFQRAAAALSKSLPSPRGWQDRAVKLEGALKLALEYWAHRQQRYKNRHPVWVQTANDVLAEPLPSLLESPSCK